MTVNGSSNPISVVAGSSVTVSFKVNLTISNPSSSPKGFFVKT